MKLTKHLGAAAALGVLLLAGLMVSPASANQVVTTPNGTWTAHPGQSSSYQTTVQPPINPDGTSNDGIFRIVDCKYMYNLATTSLKGVGTYTVSAIINGTTASPPAKFDLK